MENDKWISVKDKLPKIKYKYFKDDNKCNVSALFLVCYEKDGKRYLTTGMLYKYYKKYWLIAEEQFSNFREPINVTHWMKLPYFNDNRWIDCKKSNPETTEHYSHKGDEDATDEEDLESIAMQNCSKKVLVIRKTTIHNIRGVYKFRNICVGLYYWFWTWDVAGDNIDESKQKITHWMPLPEKP
jgi:hypothetical protein